MAKRAAISGAALIGVTLSIGCGHEPPSSAASTTAAFDPEPIPSARRPTKRYFLSRTSERCEIFFEDGEERSEPQLTPCPEYMLIGERIRIAGRACFLVNRAQPEREKPVICPDPLTRFEKHDRGEEKPLP